MFQGESTGFQLVKEGGYADGGHLLAGSLP